jgi:hypothetical protein
VHRYREHYRNTKVGPEGRGPTSKHKRCAADVLGCEKGTKRKEDMAYSPLGIFGIATSMIYGEGEEQAFFRLQQEIMKKAPDHSILAWGLGELGAPLATDYPPATAGRILAATSADFANSGTLYHELGQGHP